MQKRYEDSLFYQIGSTAKYFDMLFEQIFKELNMGLTAPEHLALSVIAETEACCQRDLARIILKDRANTGKLAKKLEEKGLIKIESKTKNNKLVKILTLTRNGEKMRKDISKKIQPIIDKIKTNIDEDSVKSTIEGLKNFRQIVQKAVKTNI